MSHEMATSTYQSGNGMTLPTESNTTSDPDIEIDSALQAALRESRERMNLLKLEQSIIDFVNSPAEWMEVGGLGNAITVGPSVSQQIPIPSDYRPATSFQRCICHRLADRFGIVRESGVILEGAIRLIKLPETRIPALLLQNVDMSSYEGQSQPTSNNVTDGNPATMFTAVDGKRPKMKLMKRKDSNTSASSKQSKTLQQNRSSGSLTDKERAYEEARARIFGTESPQMDEDEGRMDGMSNSQSAATSASLSDMASAFEVPTSSSSSNLAALSSSTSNFEHKAIYRNRLEEAADPDFQRGVRVYAPTAYAPPATAAAVAPAYPFVSPKAAPVLYPSSIFTAAAPTSYYYPQSSTTTTPAATVVSTATSNSKSAGLTADAPAFYPFGQSAR